MLKKIMLCLGLLGIAAQASEPNLKALTNAIKDNDITAVKSMLDWLPGKDKNAVKAFFGSSSDKSPFQVAAYEGNKEAFDCLIQGLEKAGIDPAEYIEFSHFLEAAAYGGNLDIMQEVFSWIQDEDERQEIINEMDNCWGAPLIGAAQGGHVEVVKWLFQQGIDATAIDIPDFIGYSKNDDVVKMLFDCLREQGQGNRMWTSIGDDDENAFLGAARNSECGQDVFALLVQEAKNDNIDLSECLTKEDNQGRNIIFWAATHENPEIVKYVLGNLSADKSKEMLSSALMKVAQYSSYRNAQNAFKLLIDEAKDKGIDPNECLIQNDKDGENIFYYASRGRNIEIVKYVLENIPADKSKEMIESKNKDYETALDYARKHKRPEIANMLSDFLLRHP